MRAITNWFVLQTTKHRWRAQAAEDLPKLPQTRVDKKSSESEAAPACDADTP
jgi:hypothetical protein